MLELGVMVNGERDLIKANSLRLLPCGFAVFKEPAVGVGDAVAEGDFRAPAEG